MNKKMPTVIEHFDDLFNDDFIEGATEEEIELRFDHMKKVCAKDNFRSDEVMEELEFYCNSFIANIASA